MKRHPKHSNINKMKRQRNTQQVKEQDKCPPNQTREKEIGNLPDKEFQIMIVKMIQSLEKKITDKQAGDKDRENAKKVKQRPKRNQKSQYVMNNAINDIKNTLEGTNHRITEAKDRISEVEDRMVEINEQRGEKKKELKEMRTTSDTSGKMLNAPTFESQESLKKKTKRKTMRKYLRR